LGTAVLDQVSIRGVRSETERDGTHSLGDGVHLRGGVSTLTNLTVTDAEGSAVFVTATAKVTIAHLRSERAGEGALVVERDSTVEADDVASTDTVSPAVAALDGATLGLNHVVVRGSEVPLWAECAARVSVRVGAMQPPLKTQQVGPCVTAASPSRPATDR
jgi:hypothetical protein